jgi:histidinol-phosphate aminotransferase
VTYEYERVATPASGRRLHLNENTAGCSPAVIDALRALTRQDAAFYPDYGAALDATAAFLGVSPDRVLLTNGLDEGILAASVAAMRGFSSDSPAEAIVVLPAFDMYAACTDAAGGRVVEIAPAPDLSFSVTRVLSAVTDRTRLVWLTTPNNPTGRLIPRAAILEIAAAAPRALVFVDEAYADFSGVTLVADPVLDRLPNLVVGRTFAKAHGLAALRAGALVAGPATLATLRRVVPPYSINACAAAALPAALGDREYFAWYLDQVRRSKTLLYGALGRLRVEHWRSDANFVLARFPGDTRDLVRELAARGIVVRDRSADAGCAGCLRMTAGVVDDTTALIAALEEVLCGAAL